MEVTDGGKVVHILKRDIVTVRTDWRRRTQDTIDVQSLTGIYQVQVDTPFVTAVGLSHSEDPHIPAHRLSTIGR